MPPSAQVAAPLVAAARGLPARQHGSGQPRWYACSAVPIYEYKCPNGHVFERFQRISDPSPDGCDECGAGPVQRVLYPVAVHFKGSGFYSTDYGRGSRKKDGSNAEPSKTDGGSGGDGGGGEKVEKQKAAEA
jgi:putative FmdB family regulatory protein